jgi:hypothetical protein
MSPLDILQNLGKRPPTVRKVFSREVSQLAHDLDVISSGFDEFIQKFALAGAYRRRDRRTDSTVCLGRQACWKRDAVPGSFRPGRMKVEITNRLEVRSG